MNKPRLNEVPSNPDPERSEHRRHFLQSLGKWSGAAILAATGGLWLGNKPEAWAGAWVNRRIGGGGWVNGAGWINHAGGWINGGGGGGWINRRGVGGGAWVNRR